MFVKVAGVDCTGHSCFENLLPRPCLLYEGAEQCQLGWACTYCMASNRLVQSSPFLSAPLASVRPALYPVPLVGFLPLLGKQIAAIAADITANTAKQRRTAAKAKTEQEAAEAAHAHTHLPHHRDISVGLHLLSLWRGLAAIRSGLLLRACSNPGSRTNSRPMDSSSRIRCSSSSLQETVLPACDLAVSLLKTWPPNIAGPAHTSTSSSSSSMPFPGAIPRSDVSGLALSVSKILLLAVQSELQPVSPADPPPSAADARF
jgi:hypothetical protein